LCAAERRSNALRQPSPYRLYLIYCGVTSFLFALAFTVAAVYRVQSAGLSPLQLVLVGTTLEVTYFLFNVPTGVVADTYSRRLSVIVGVVLWSLAFVLEGAIPVFAWILVAQAISALGYTFVEGAIEAWLTDEIGEEALGPALLRGGQVGRMAAFFGIGGSVALASVRLNLPLLVAGAIFLLFGLYLVVVMREPGFRRPPRAETFGLTNRTRSALREMAGTTRAGARVMRRRPLALTVVAVAAIFGGFSEGFDRLWEAHFLGPIGLPGLGRLEPVVWFGIIEAGAMLLGIGAAELFRRRVDLERPAASIRALFALEAVLMVAVIALALAGSFALALAAFWLASVARGLVGPVYMAWINRGVDSQARATVLSMTAQADALGQFTVGPGLGATGSAFGLRAALTAAGLALTPALGLYGRALGKVSRGKGIAAEPVDAAG
jgi:DHA3 family tetracycline resistance protein-like MFS transporter